MEADTVYFIGIDIGGSHASVGLVSENGQVLETENLSTPDYPQLEDFVHALGQSVRRLCQRHSVGLLSAVGIGAPNGNYYQGTIEYPPNLPWSGISPLADLLSEELNRLPVRLTNDANAAAMGELEFGWGAREGLRDFITITLGTGLGSGIVADGRLVYGHDGFAGELGHVLVEPGGRLCGCGRQGCLERYVSATGIALSAVAVLEQSPIRSALRRYSTKEITSKHIYQAALEGDRLALALFDDTARILALALANATAVTSPSAFIFSGGLAQAGDLLLEPLRRHFAVFVPRIYADKVRMLPSLVPDNQVAVLGAAALVRHLKSPSWAGI